MCFYQCVCEWSLTYSKLVQTKQTSKRKAKNVLLSMRLWVKPNLFKVSANEANVKEKSKECAFISAFVSEAYNNSPKSLRQKRQNILSLILNHINSSNQSICCYKYPNTQRRRCCANIPMNVPLIANVITTQRRRCCAFDSPGLARNEPTLG